MTPAGGGAAGRLTGEALVARVHELIRDVPDFPSPGVGFKDITPLLADAEAFASVVAELAARCDGPVDLVAGTEARGFILAAPVALALGAGFIPVRKAGKLPGPVLSEEFSLEYGAAVVEIHPFTVPRGSRVLIVDDVLATGGTAAATVRLFESCGAEVVGLSFLVDLEFLGGKDKLTGHRVESVVTVTGHDAD